MAGTTKSKKWRGGDLEACKLVEAFVDVSKEVILLASRKLRNPFCESSECCVVRDDDVDREVDVVVDVTATKLLFQMTLMTPIKPS
eukprot:681878-Amphidinium_carterae.3